MSWNRLQSRSGSVASGTSCTAAYLSNMTAGTKMVAVISVAAGGAAIATSTVKDTAGNSFTKLASVALNNSTTTGELSLWAIDTPAGDVGAAPTITATFSSTCAGSSMLIEEVSGLATGATLAAMIDGTPGTNAGKLSGSGNQALASPTYSSTAANEYLVCCYGDDGLNGASTWSAPSGYTADPNAVNTNGNDDCALSANNSTAGAETGAYTANVGTAFSNDYAQILCAFKLAGGAVAAVTPSSPPLIPPGRRSPMAFRYNPLPSVSVAPSSVTHPGTAPLDGNGSLTGAGVFAGAAVLSGSGTLGGSAVFAAGAALSGTGTIGAAGVLAGAASLSGSGTLTATATKTVPGAAVLSGTGTLTASGVLAGSAALSGSGTLTAGGFVAIPGAAVLSGSGTLGAAGVFASAATLAGSGTLGATGTAILFSSATLSGTGTLTAAGVLAGSAVLSGTGSLTASAVFAVSAALSGSGTLLASGVLAGAAVLSGSGTLGATGAVHGIHSATAALGGSGTLTAGWVLSLPGAAALSGSGTLTGAGVFAAGAALSGSGSLGAAGVLAGSVTLSGTGTLTGTGRFAGAAILSGAGTLTGAKTIGWPGTAVLAGTGTLAATGSRVSSVLITGQWDAQPAPSWAAVPVPAQWGVQAYPSRWRITVANFDPISAVSQEQVNIAWSTELAGTTIDPTGQTAGQPVLTVQYAFPVSSGNENTPAAPLTWYPATWLAGQAGRGYISQCPVGTGTTGPTLAAGKYDVWGEVAVGSTLVRKFAGVLTVY